MSAAFDTKVDASSPTYDPTPRPLQPRELTQRELEKLDVYGYRSVKEHRPTMVVGLHALTVALSLEFDPQVNAYAERPRKLQVADRTIELDFWVRYRSGREEFIKLIANSDTVAAPGRRVARERERLNAAASHASLSLKLVTEEETLSATAPHANRLLLLPLLQVAQGLAHGLALRGRMLTLLGVVPRLRIAQLEQELEAYPSSDVHAVLAELFYLGLIHAEQEKRLTRQSLVWRTSA